MVEFLDTNFGGSDINSLKMYWYWRQKLYKTKPNNKERKIQTDESIFVDQITPFKYT